MLSLKLLSPVISLPSYVVSIFHTFIASSLFNILTVLALYLLLLLLRHCYHPLKITHCSFRYASPGLWNQLPLPHSDTSSPVSNSPIPSPLLLFLSPLCSSITTSVFHWRLETYLFHKSSPQYFYFFPQTAFTDYHPDRFSELLGF